MSSLKLQGATSGEITVTVPNVAGTNTLTLPAATGTLTTTDVATNTPIFYGEIGSTQSIVDVTTTKLAFDTVIVDTDSGFNTSTNTYTIPSGKGGKYAVSAFTRIDSLSASNMSVGQLMIFVNDTLVRRAYDFLSNSYVRAIYPSLHTILDLSAGDTIYVSAYANTVNGANASISGDTYSGFSLHRLIG